MQGQSTQLDCSVQPEQLLHFYRASWDKSGIPIQTTSEEERSRYSINPANLSLVINDVQLDDTSDQYHCVLTVVDPNSNGMLNTYNYHDTLEKNNISLVVLGE